jgi:hemoglobin-like flavoprotein
MTEAGRKRTKTWEQKVAIVEHSFLRCSNDALLASKFYVNLFFLKPKIKEYFKDTDFKHQEIALINGLKFMIGFLDKTDENSRDQIKRLATVHSNQNLNIHPHDYYYWMDALLMTIKECDDQWYPDLEYYWREAITYPVYFMISLYFK